MDEVEMYDLGFEDSLSQLQPQFDGDWEYMEGYNDAQADAGLPLRYSSQTPNSVLSLLSQSRRR
jgi:hypothetical protein